MPKTYDHFAPQYDAVMRPLARWFLTRLRTQAFDLLPRKARVLVLSAGTARNSVFDPFAPQYDAVMRPLERWFLTRLRTQAFDLLPRNARVLELGAGTGRNFVFYPFDTSGVASEPSREMLKIAKDRQRPPNVTLVQS